MNASEDILQGWPEESREAAQLVIDKYGEPDEATESFLVWHNPGPWKRMVAYKEFANHNFPAPHIDAVESVIEYHVPVDKVDDLSVYDGSVTYRRTQGELSATCHDEEANFLAINLAHDVITGKRSVEEAREYYKKEFLDFRRKEPTPYMEGLKFEPPGDGDTDERNITDEELEQAQAEGAEK